MPTAHSGREHSNFPQMYGLGTFSAISLYSSGSFGVSGGITAFAAPLLASIDAIVALSWARLLCVWFRL